MDNFLKTIHELTDIVGPSGRESKVANYLKKNWNEYGEVKEDRLGNLSITIGNKIIIKIAIPCQIVLQEKITNK